jgi:hypothetical protein
MKLFPSGKKAVYEDVMTIVIVLVSIGITVIFAYYILNTFVTNPAFTSFYSNVPANAVDLPNLYLRALRIFDYVMVVIMVALIVSLGIINTQVATNKVYAWISFLIAPFLFFSSYMLNYIFSQIVTQPAFSAILGYFSLTVLICTNLHWIALVSFCIALLSMYGKKDSGQFVTWQGGRRDGGQQ